MIPPCLRSTLLLCIAPLLLLATGRDAFTQTQSLFGNRGPAGQIGTNLTGSMVGQGTTFGSTSGTNGLSGQPLGGNLDSTQRALTGQGTTANGFVGRNDNAGRFVGDQRTTQQIRTMARGEFRNNASRNRVATGSQFGGNQAGKDSRRKARIIRPRQKIAFSFPSRLAADINIKLGARLNRLPIRKGLVGTISVAVNDQGTALLTGMVDSPETKRLVAIMARLEPGVRGVENRLEVSDIGPSQ